jgi:arylsulfatase A-like enzyme
MHFRTHVKRRDAARWPTRSPAKHVDEYTAGMIEHDMHIGQFLDLLDELGIADNTIVFYSTDNGPHMNTWPDAAMTPFRGEKNTNWEGGWRVPAMVRWPGVIEAGLGVQRDHAPHGLAADLPGRRRAPRHQGRADRGRHRRGRSGASTACISTATTSCPTCAARTDDTPAQEIFYFSDDGDLTALRYNDWKAIFLEHRYPQTLRAWAEPWTPLRIPLLFNLRRDPYERSQITSNTYYDWYLDRAFVLLPAAELSGSSWPPSRSSRRGRSRAASPSATPPR